MCMQVFYSGMKGIRQFNANFLSYTRAKYCQNWSTSDLVIVKTRRVNFFETQCNIIGHYTRIGVSYAQAYVSFDSYVTY